MLCELIYDREEFQFFFTTRLSHERSGRGIAAVATSTHYRARKTGNRDSSITSHQVSGGNEPSDSEFLSAVKVTGGSGVRTSHFS